MYYVLYSKFCFRGDDIGELVKNLNQLKMEMDTWWIHQDLSVVVRGYSVKCKRCLCDHTSATRSSSSVHVNQAALHLAGNQEFGYLCRELWNLKKQIVENMRVRKSSESLWLFCVIVHSGLHPSKCDGGVKTEWIVGFWRIDFIKIRRL